MPPYKTPLSLITPRSLIWVLLLALLAPALALAGNGDESVLLRIAESDIEDVENLYGFDFDDADGFLEGGQWVFELEVSEVSVNVFEALELDERVTVDTAGPARIPTLDAAGFAGRDLGSQELATGRLSTGCRTGGLVPNWTGYSHQFALGQVGVAPTERLQGNCGRSVVVAVIDTGIASTLPSLDGVLLPGYDFVLDREGASEWRAVGHKRRGSSRSKVEAAVQQSITAIVEGQGVPVVVDQSITAIVEQSITAIVEDLELPTAFGHGTLVAGLVHAVAPEARILPIRAFDGKGEGDVFDIVRAIYYAVDRGADVINLSFSTTSNSPELLRAIEFAKGRGVACVAAVGNQGRNVLTYPAAFDDVAGVAAIEDNDSAAHFTNVGEAVAISAPGERLISLFPGGLYAAVWGTSFSAPLVSGAVALVIGRSYGDAQPGEALGVIKEAARPHATEQELGEGVLDIAEALVQMLRSRDSVPDSDPLSDLSDGPDFDPEDEDEEEDEEEDEDEDFEEDDEEDDD
ncbi:MAG: S8 family serine peptidase [Acidobacteriota bacterium]